MAGTGFCDVCGGRIEGRRSHAKYCSSACARAAYAKAWLPALQKALRYLERECRRLGNQITGTRRRGRPGA